MVKRWIEEEAGPDNAFESFIDLYKAWLTGKTGDPARLQLKIDQVWSGFTKEQRKAYSAQLLAMGLLYPDLGILLKFFNGSIAKWR